MTDLPKLPGGWVWGMIDEYDPINELNEWWATAERDEPNQRIESDGATRAEAIARVVAMVEAVVGSENKEARK